MKSSCSAESFVPEEPVAESRWLGCGDDDRFDPRGRISFRQRAADQLLGFILRSAATASAGCGSCRPTSTRRRMHVVLAGRTFAGYVDSISFLRGWYVQR